MKLLSAFGGGLFIIPLLTLFGALWFFYVAYQARNSGWKKTDRTGTSSGSEKLPYTAIGQFWFGVALIVATIVIAFIMYGDR